MLPHQQHLNIEHTMYPTATIVGTKNGSKSFHATSTAQWELVGEGTFNLTDSKVLMKWPVTFGSTWNDSYAGNTFFGPGTGTISASASGHGQVILPGFIFYNNCMQVTTHDEVQLTAAGMTLTQHQYLYYHDTQRFPILTVTYSELKDGTDTTKSYDIEVNYLLAVGLNDYNFDASFAIYPNPASNHFNVKLSNENAENCGIEIFNITGQKIKQLDLGNAGTIDQKIQIDDLSTGIYMVKTRLGDKTSTRRLVVQ
jgi:hypothetical protein